MAIQEPIHVKLNPLDHLPPRNYVKVVFYLPLKSGTDPGEVFGSLREGLHQTFVQLPWLSGKVHWQAPETPGWRPGQLEIRYHPVLEDGPRPYQLRFKDLSADFSYAELKEDGFPTDAFEDEDVLWAPFLADVDQGAEVFVAQANFVPGGCLLAMSICHSASDATAMITVMKTWAESCRGRSELPPELSDRTLLERLWAEENKVRTSTKPSAETWTVVGLDPPIEEKAANGATEGGAPAATAPAPTRVMKSGVFYVSGANLAALQKQCAQEPGGSELSSNDVVSALLWRGLLRARAAVSKTPLGDVSELETTVDGRPEFSQAVPPAYLGNVVFVNHGSLPLAELTADATPLGRVARVIRARARHIHHDTLHQAYGLLRSVSGFGEVRLRFTHVEGADLCISNLFLMPVDDIAFDGRYFDNGGRPESMRVLMGAFSRFFRIAYVLPRKSHGGVELSFSLFDEELEWLLQDEEFERYCLQIS